jgi:ribosomal-protein-alanine N-acetyltransferase
MLIQSPPKTHLRSATEQDLHKLANLIHFESFVHRHLDYRPPLDWLGKDPFLVLEQNKSIVSTLACPPDPICVAWIRLFAATTRSQATAAWAQLWEQAGAHLRQDRRTRWAAAIPMQSWFEEIISRSGFEQTHSIVMLSWERKELAAIQPSPEIHIRPMSLDDLHAVHRVDTAAFPPIWQHSLAYLELAFRQAVIASIAEQDGQIVGYQVSTATPIGGHLARLAVAPDLQGRGIGRLLLHDLLEQFTRRGGRIVTVNTQKNNAASLSLYRSMGFTFTQEEYPVYQLALD